MTATDLKGVAGWLIAGLLGLILTILWKYVDGQKKEHELLQDKQDQILASVNALNSDRAANKEKFKNIDSAISRHEKALEDHGKILFELRSQGH